MSYIKKLAPEVASRIAAGEVVERPYNVVKELIENSVDAGATKITVEIADGGLSLIRIIDNGKGIEKDDLPLALERFATSKAESVEDVYSANTFGFRGEALAAISSVSNFTLTSGTENNATWTIKSRFAETSEIKPAPAIKGTIIEVVNLFENVPARRKFLKSARSLDSEIVKFVKHFSLINQQIEITLISNGKVVFEVFANEDITMRASKVFTNKGFYEGNIEYDNTKVKVAATLPADSDRLKRDGIILGVNGRLIKDASIMQAVIKAYYRLIPDGRYPIVAVDLRINPNEVDANVHPAKLEVRFENQRDIFCIVSDAVEKSFKNKILISKYETKNNDDDMYKYFIEENYNSTTKPTEVCEKNIEQKAEYIFDLSEVAVDNNINIDRNNFAEINKKENFENSNIATINNENVTKSKIEFKIIGQIANSFIVCETLDNQILFIDQHAAHERILFEKEQKKAQVEKTTIVLHNPIELNLTDEQYDCLLDNKDVIESYGYSIDLLDKEKIYLTRIPYNVVRKDVEKIFVKILSELYVSGKSKTEDAPRALFSCKSAIKAGDKLSEYEMNYLLELLFQTDNYGTCPHGRPLIYSMSVGELARKFLR